jgi:hypothetical protein
VEGITIIASEDMTVEDASDVTGTHAERWREWDSCFTQNFSHIHRGSPQLGQVAIPAVDDSQAGLLD